MGTLPDKAERRPLHTDGAPKPTLKASLRAQYPRADASRYEPAPGRGRVWLSIRCPYCGGVHLARLRPGATPDGPRRTVCGMVWVKVRRTYRPWEAA